MSDTLPDILTRWTGGLLGGAAPSWLLWLAFTLAIAGALAGGVSAFSGVASYVERKVAAHMQARMGPMVVGPHGIFQWMADGLKVILKEDLIPGSADRPLFRLAPYIVFLGCFPVFLVLPFARGLAVADLDIGILYMVAVASLVVMGLLMSGWASGNKWALFGAMRSAAQIVSYEIPIGITILTVVMLVGSLSMQAIVDAQARGFPFDLPPTGRENWGFLSWFLLRYPLFTIPAFLIYFTASLAETNRTPFDIPEAESELVAGFHTEYSGMRFSAFFMAEYANMLAVAGIATTLFLGGWLPPYPGLVADWAADRFFAGSPWVAGLGGAAEGLAWFLGKALFLIFVMMWLRWTLPRYRVDQLMDLCWKVLVPIAFVNLLGVALFYQGGALWQQLMRLA